MISALTCRVASVPQFHTDRVHSDDIAKYVAERHRHASRQSLGHRDPPQRRASAPRRCAVNAGGPLVAPGADRLWAPGCGGCRPHDCRDLLFAEQGVS
jgi:hypothetical protein